MMLVSVNREAIPPVVIPGNVKKVFKVLSTKSIY